MQGLGILTKIMAVSVLAVSVFVIGLFVYIMPTFEEKLINEKREATKNVVDIAYSLITEYEARIRSGELTQADAHKRALTRIRNLRYREKEYFWINDLGPKMIMHPYKPELDGKDLSDFKDPKGTFLFKEMVRVSNEKGEGFVDYQWPKPGMTQPVPKISYVKLYKPWGWIVGSGIYVDDLRADISSMRWGLIAATMVVSLVILGLSFIVARRITKPLQEGVNLAGKLADGDFTGIDITVRSADETGRLAEALNKMRGGLSTLLYSTMNAVSQTASQVATTSEELSATMAQITPPRRRAVEQGFAGRNGRNRDVPDRRRHRKEHDKHRLFIHRYPEDRTERGSHRRQNRQ
ncbi:MAG: methyl-accepting chemotaxis protein [Desulfobacterales bacterium]|nr:methyl-accepting chemotaxis protein [Desulfobacterales bacterium]